MGKDASNPRGEARPQPLVVSEADAARIVGVSASSLRQGRLNGQRERRMATPPWVAVGRRILYRLEDLKEFLATHRRTPRDSTGRK